MQHHHRSQRTSIPTCSSSNLLTSCNFFKFAFSFPSSAGALSWQWLSCFLHSEHVEGWNTLHSLCYSLVERVCVGSLLLVSSQYTPPSLLKTGSHWQKKTEIWVCGKFVVYICSVCVRNSVFVDVCGVSGSAWQCVHLLCISAYLDTNSFSALTQQVYREGSSTSIDLTVTSHTSVSLQISS